MTNVRLMPSMHNNPHYLAVAEFYGDACAKRSGVPLIAHIQEGMLILHALGSSQRAMEAFCLHPLLQDDSALYQSMQAESIFNRYALHPSAVALAMEYRVVANNYLAQHFPSDDDMIALSPLAEVNQMLIADKVQNRKDFEIYHLDRHENSVVLVRYFNNWLRRLGISDARYQQLVSILMNY